MLLKRTNKTGRVITDMKNLEFPDFYSQNAIDIIASKYFRKAGDNNALGYENSMKMVADRMVAFWRDALVEEVCSPRRKKRKPFMMDGSTGCSIRCSPPTRLSGSTRDSSRATASPATPITPITMIPSSRKSSPRRTPIPGPRLPPVSSLSMRINCLDPIPISEQYVSETKLFKGGSGTGTSTHPACAGEKLSGGGISSGLMSFLKGLDPVTGAIKSGGTTRRAAKMVCLDIDHPEIETFIRWKAKGRGQGPRPGQIDYDGSFEGEAYRNGIPVRTPTTPCASQTSS